MARYLRRAGHTVTVVTTDLYGRLPPAEEKGIVRVGDLRSMRLLRAILRRGDIEATADRPEKRPTALLTKVVVPDAQLVTWVPAAFAAVRRIGARHDVDCLVTSGPPDSIHLLGLLLGSNRPAWVADFRDGWTFEPLREPFRTGAQRRLDAWLERRVAQSADVAVGATRPIADDLALRLGANAVHVPNGWDPEAGHVSPAVTANPDHDGSITLVYTGTFSGVRGSDPRPLLEALRLVHVEQRVPRVRLVVAGRMTSDDRDLIVASGAAHLVEHLGTLERSKAITLQRSADALVLITSRSVSVATGKIYEYLAAGKPIVALAEGNEAERIVRETNTGVIVPPDDVNAIAAALRQVVSGQLTAAYHPRNLERYTYPGPAEAMAEAVEQAIQRWSAFRAGRRATT